MKTTQFYFIAAQGLILGIVGLYVAWAYREFWMLCLAPLGFISAGAMFAYGQWQAADDETAKYSA